MEMQCASCGADINPNAVTCSMCSAVVACKEETCNCECGNTFAVAEAKCDDCLGA